MDALPYPIPTNEAARLEALAEFNLLDSAPADDFDRLAQLAARLFQVPIVLVSLIDHDRQFFKARVGFDRCETSREVSFCAHAIVQNDVLCVLDTLADIRFASNPLVLGPPFIRFYAGMPLSTEKGEKVGTLCLIDTKPRTHFSDDERQNLADIARLVMDRMEWHRLDYVRAISQTRFETIAGTSSDAIICVNAEDGVTFWNRSAEKLFGYSAAEMAHQSYAIIVPERRRSDFEAELNQLRCGEHSPLVGKTLELFGLHKDGSEIPISLSLSTWDEGGMVNVGAIIHDLRERRENEERLFRLASIDALTELPNRMALGERLDELLASRAELSVLLLDLDGFKRVNDALGHAVGDDVLKEVARRLTVVCPEAIMLARLAGNEFVALMPGCAARVAQRCAARLLEAISAPYQVASQPIQMGVSIGVALAPMDGLRSEDLLRAADLALYRAKAAGRGRYEMFKPIFREVDVARRAFEYELQLAFERGEFELYYQPQVATNTRALVGAEALMRWNHPTRGVLTPASFMDVLSQRSSAAEVGNWTIHAACRAAVPWQAHIPDFRVGVNLFAAQLRSEDILQTVKHALSASGLPARCLELEIVENISLRDDPATLALLKKLRGLGVGLAFDDYGTGYASLSLLKRLPVTRLKIDKSFIRDVNGNAEDAAVVKAIIYLGRRFGLDVIAEGVEKESQLAFLSKGRCAEAQGFLFGKPIPASEFTATFFDRGSASNHVRALPQAIDPTAVATKVSAMFEGGPTLIEVQMPDSHGVTLSNSTSNTSEAPGGMALPAPSSP